MTRRAAWRQLACGTALLAGVSHGVSPTHRSLAVPRMELAQVEWPEWPGKLFGTSAGRTSDDGLNSTPTTHIVMILVDDLGWNDVSWHGGEIPTTHLDQLVNQGLNLAEMHAHSVCTPSRASLLTGRYAFHTGLQHGQLHTGEAFGLPLDVPVISEQLREVGYATYMVGKWHLGHQSWAHTPLERGFDSFFGILGSGEDYYTQKVGGVPDLWENCEPSNATGRYSTTLFTDKAISAITSHVDRHGVQKPMFLYVAYQGVGEPLQGPPKSERVALNAHIADHSRRKLAEMVAHLDSSIERITNTLKARDMWSNTLLVFSSDNGGATWAGSSNWPLRGGKSTMWQGGHKVPSFVVHGGSALKRTKNFVLLTHLIDLAPTFLAVAGVPQAVIDKKGYDGMNLWPVWTGEEASNDILHRTLVLNIDTTNSESALRDGSQWAGYAGIRDLAWKLVLGSPGEPSGLCGTSATGATPASGNCSWVPLTGAPTDLAIPHLWHLRSDPTESIDVAAKHPHIVNLMKQRLEPYFKSAREPINADGPASGKATREATMMAHITAGWTPWERCPEKKPCQCEKEALLTVLQQRMAASR